MLGIFKFKKDEFEEIDKIIAKVQHEMDVYGPDSDEFPALLSYMERLTRLKAESRHQMISPDTLFIGAVNLIGILIIVTYEHNHVMVTKAKDFILKLTV